MITFNFDSLPPLELLPAEIVKLIKKREEIYERYRAASQTLLDLITGSSLHEAQEADKAETVELVKNGKPGTRKRAAKHHSDTQTARRAQADLSATLAHLGTELTDALIAAAPAIAETSAAQQEKTAEKYRAAVTALEVARDTYWASIGLTDWTHRIMNPSTSSDKIVFTTAPGNITLNPGTFTERNYTAEELHASLDHDTRAHEPVERKQVTASGWD